MKLEKLNELYELMCAFQKDYRKNCSPELNDAVELICETLFNTLAEHAGDELKVKGHDGSGSLRA